jgi:glycogen operon protein
MLLGGDELGRTQHGNNNAWCQDNEVSWFDWQLGESGERLLEFTRRLIRLRRDHPVFRRPHFLLGRTANGSGLPDVWWVRTDGLRMAQHDWQRGGTVLGVFLNGREILDRTPDGEQITGDSFLVLLNAGAEDVTFRLPPSRFGRQWTLELSTADPTLQGVGYRYRQSLTLESRSLSLLRRP